MRSIQGDERGTYSRARTSYVNGTQDISSVCLGNMTKTYLLQCPSELLLTQGLTRDAVSIAVKSMRVTLRPTSGYEEHVGLTPRTKVATITIRATNGIPRRL